MLSKSLFSIARQPTKSFYKKFTTTSLLRSSAEKTSTNTPTESTIPGFRAPGEIATNWELATGAERYEYLKKLQGQDPWEDLHPIYLTKKGTPKEPIIVKGVDPERYIGCTGHPDEVHDAVWLTLRPRTKGFDRCPHCGNTFKYIQEEEEHH